MNHPRRMDFMTICRAIPQIAVQFQHIIPDTFWTIATGSRDIAGVRCPCGRSPAAERLIPVACDCGRHFLYDGHGVRVARYQTADGV